MSSNGNEVNQVTDADVFVFTKNECPYCTQLKLALDRAGIAYDWVNIETPGNEHLAEQLREEGVSSMPSVRTRLVGNWNGSRPDKVVELKMAVKAEAAEAARLAA